MQIITRCFNRPYNGISHVLTSEVQIYHPFDPTTPPDPKDCKKYIAIWDTGATGTVITEKVITECGLQPVGVTQVNTPNGQTTSNVYLISVWLPNHVRFAQVRATEGILLDPTDVLIGMDIITTGDFAVTNKDGKTNFTFRHPSVECIDFVKQQPMQLESEGQMLKKVGRNDPCPCGSGKKYKRCCGK